MTNQEAKEYLVNEGYADGETRADTMVSAMTATSSYSEYHSSGQWKNSGSKPITESIYTLIKG
tara:strand:- start:23 stop:211 length:189 start_codon:yes stop_codon:yes gene_type:complete